MAESDPQFVVAPFEPAADDPLSAEHAIVTAWIDEALALQEQYVLQRGVDMKSTSAGKTIVESDAETAHRLVMAAIAQLFHLDRETERVRAQATNAGSRLQVFGLPGGSEISGRRVLALEILITLMRRALPFAEPDLISISEWLCGQFQINTYNVPASAIVKAIERFAKANSIGDPLRNSIRRCAQKLRAAYDKELKRCATTLEQITEVVAPVEPVKSDSPARPVIPAASGHPGILAVLKQFLGVQPLDDSGAVVRAPERLEFHPDSPLREEHALLGGLFMDAIAESDYQVEDMERYAAGRAMLERSPDAMARLLLAAAERVATVVFANDEFHNWEWFQTRSASANVLRSVCKLGWVRDRDYFFDFILFLSARPRFSDSVGLESLVAHCRKMSESSPLTQGERFTLFLWRASLVQGPLLGSPPPEVLQLSQLIGDGAGFYLVPDEHWSTRLNQDIHEMAEEKRLKWIALLKHWLTATAARPSAKWLKTVGQLVKDAGGERVAERLIGWLSHVPDGRIINSLPSYPGDTRNSGDIIHQENANCLRGMLWTLPAFRKNRDEITRIIATVAQSAYKKIPGVGPRAVKVGNAAVYALSELGTTDAVGQLAMLKVRVRFGTAQKEIEKAFNLAAAALGLPREEIEELGVPAYGLEEVGIRRETFDDATALLRVDGGEVEIQWTSGGKIVKSVPAKVKSAHADELKELQVAVKDIAAMLPAQAQRLDAMFLLEKHWPQAIWRERYLDHPLVGTLARRLIWTSAGGKSFGWVGGKLLDAHDQPITLADDAQVSLWHPINRTTTEVLDWRAWMERHQIKQPFKQAHREIYLLTDAERRTATYSNRFAGHVLRQHQFNALCGARGWKNKLRLLVDASYPPATRDLPQWGLRAEYWIEGIGDAYGADTNESGVFLRLATDQVRFYRTGAGESLAHAGGGGYTMVAGGTAQPNGNESLPIDQVPALVLSEILRDVDLFVGVASVGNDPTWQDGGPGGRFRDYWHSYGFGDLSETARTRKAVLETLLPRLTKLRDRWRLDDKFLNIRGEIRSYKIHLGSGNILMEPNDQYLCIVPDRSPKAAGNEMFLPFEGDATLSIIISKAFLLAADSKITDATIVRQIKG